MISESMCDALFLCNISLHLYFIANCFKMQKNISIHVRQNLSLGNTIPPSDLIIIFGRVKKLCVYKAESLKNDKKFYPFPSSENTPNHNSKHVSEKAHEYFLMLNDFRVIFLAAIFK